MANNLYPDEISAIKFSDGSKKGKMIEKQYALIRDTEKVVKKALQKVQCVCTHQGEDRHPTIKIKRDNGGKIAEYTCYRCGKKVTLAQVDEKELAKAIEVIDAVCDQIKMCANPQSDKDLKIIKQNGKLQFSLLDLEKQYKVIKNPQSKKRNGGNGRNRSGQGSTWSR